MSEWSERGEQIAGQIRRTMDMFPRADGARVGVIELANQIGIIRDQLDRIEAQLCNANRSAT